MNFGAFLLVLSMTDANIAAHWKAKWSNVSSYLNVPVMFHFDMMNKFETAWIFQPILVAFVIFS